MFFNLATDKRTCLFFFIFATELATNISMAKLVLVHTRLNKYAK